MTIRWIFTNPLGIMACHGSMRFPCLMGSSLADVFSEDGGPLTYQVRDGSQVVTMSHDRCKRARVNNHH